MDTVKIQYRDQEWEVKSGMTVRDAIQKGGIDPSAVLALKNKKLINDQTILEAGDEIRLVNVISGG